MQKKILGIDPGRAQEGLKSLTLYIFLEYFINVCVCVRERERVCVCVCVCTIQYKMLYYFDFLYIEC
jgi:hypothetical protein